MSIAEELLKTPRMEGMPMKGQKQVPNLINALNFLRGNVLNVSDITRSTKLSEILNSFAGVKSEEIFIVQNSKSKDAQGALVDIEYLLELLKYKEVFDDVLEEVSDEMLVQDVLEREGLSGTKTIGEAASQFALDWDDIMQAKDKVEID